MKKNTKYTLIMVSMTLAVMLIIFELTSMVILSRLSFYLPQPVGRPGSGRAGTFQFSRDLGWEPNYPGTRKYRGEAKKTDGAGVSLFGDSFTRGHPDITKSWAYLLEGMIEHPIYNFGVSAYGPDQAYLRFEKRFPGGVESPYVILGIMSENIGRIVNRYRGFYVRRPNLYLPKPRFVLDPDGNLRLIPNPLRELREITLLDDMDFLRRVGEGDYWFDYYGQYGLNRKIGFPWSVHLVRAFPCYLDYFRHLRMKNHMAYHHLYEDPATCSLLKQIILRFIRRAEDRQAVPIVLFLPNSVSLENYLAKGKTVYDDFFREISSCHPHTFNALDYFIPHLEDGDEIVTFFRADHDGHYGIVGEEIVAAGVCADLLAVDQQYRLLGKPLETGNNQPER